MADTTNNARFFLSSKETYYQMKADQKAFLPNTRYTISSDYQKLVDAWYAKKPANPNALSDWRNSRPQQPWVLTADARSMNIVYGMIRGHAYRDIEKTYREYNGPSKNSIQFILNHYGIDYDAFIDACGAIDYE